MLDARRAAPAVRAVVIHLSIAIGLAVGAAACAAGGEGSGSSPFTSSDPPIVVPVASADAAPLGASASMPDGCPDVAEASLVATVATSALEASSPDQPETSDEDASGDDAAEQDAAEDGAPSTVTALPPLPVPG